VGSSKKVTDHMSFMNFLNKILIILYRTTYRDPLEYVYMEDISTKGTRLHKFIVAYFIVKGPKTSFVIMWFLLQRGFVRLSVFYSQNSKSVSA
jgi:hypothetical protein